MIDPKVLKRLIDSEDGRTLQRHITEQCLLLDSVSDIALDDKEEATIEMKARKRAIERLKVILTDMLLVDSARDSMKSEKDDYSVNVE